MNTDAEQLKGMRMAERVGFEPTVPVSRNNRLAGDPDQPLQHLSAGVTAPIVT
jgi:hypothetical protein